MSDGKPGNRVREVQESYDRLRERAQRELGEDIPAVKYVPYADAEPEVLSPAEWLREHGEDGVAKIRHRYDPESSLLAPTAEEREVETLRAENARLKLSRDEHVTLYVEADAERNAARLELDRLKAAAEVGFENFARLNGHLDAALEHNRHLTQDIEAWKKTAGMLRNRVANHETQAARADEADAEAAKWLAKAGELQARVAALEAAVRDLLEDVPCGCVICIHHGHALDRALEASNG